MFKHKLMLALASSFVLSGCATIVTGNKQTIKIDSNPQGATVFTAVKTQDGKFLKRAEAGVTPLDVTIERKDGAVLLEKDGYQPAEVPVERGMNGWVFGDIVLGSLLSTSIDTSTGAAKEYDPNQYLVQMTPVGEMPAAPAPAPSAAPTPQ